MTMSGKHACDYVDDSGEEKRRTRKSWRVHSRMFDGAVWLAADQETVSNDGIKVPRVLEFTLLRGEHISQTAPATEFPHPLDRDNLAGKPTLELPALWYRD